MTTLIQEQFLQALAHPYQTALMPAFLSGQSRDIKKFIKILLFTSSDKKSIEALTKLISKAKSDTELLSNLRNHILRLSQEEAFYKKFADYYGLNYEQEKDKLIDAVKYNVLRSLKIAFNHIVENHLNGHIDTAEITAQSSNLQNSSLRLQFNEDAEDFKNFLKVADAPKNKNKLKERTFKRVTDKLSFVLTLLVATGQAGIAAMCFIIAGIAQPWFWPIFIAAFITNFFLMKSDITSLLRNIVGSLFFKKDFLNGLQGKMRYLAYASLLFAIASGLSFGFMALSTTFSAYMAIMPVLGLGALAIPGIGWTIAAIVAIATMPVLTALMFGAMANFIKSFNSNLQKIKAYYDLNTHFFGKSLKEKCTFLLSRTLQSLLAVAAVGITFFAVIATFGGLYFGHYFNAT